MTTLLNSVNLLLNSVSILPNSESNLQSYLNKEVQYFFVDFLYRIERLFDQVSAIKRSWRPLPNPDFPPSGLFHFLLLKYLLIADHLRD